MKRSITTLCLAAIAGAATAQTFLGPSPYLQFSDSPWAAGTFQWFYLEDAEDGLANTPGITSSHTALGSDFGVTFIDSVDADDGEINGVGNSGPLGPGESFWASGSIVVEFDAGVLGALPTHAGAVWTDGSNDITFEAWDENDVSLGTIGGSHADGNFASGTAEDRFYGIEYAGGISRIALSNPGGIEIDHIQYGLVPEPATLAALGLGAAALLRRRRHVQR